MVTESCISPKPKGEIKLNCNRSNAPLLSSGKTISNEIHLHLGCAPSKIAVPAKLPSCRGSNVPNPSRLARQRRRGDVAIAGAITDCQRHYYCQTYPVLIATAANCREWRPRPRLAQTGPGRRRTKASTSRKGPAKSDSGASVSTYSQLGRRSPASGPRTNRRAARRYARTRTDRRSSTLARPAGHGIRHDRGL